MLRLLNKNKQFVKELEFKGGETYQYFFGTEQSLKYLKKL